MLSIGEMSKFTGVGIQALRYYDRKNILKPARIDPDTGYRYYTFEQANSVDVISACVELDIPLKELADLFDTDDYELLREFFLRNKEAALRKQKVVNTMLCLADKALTRMEMNRLYEIGQIYKREIPEKFYYVKPCERPSENRVKTLVDFAEEVKRDLEKKKVDIESFDESLVLMEYGFMRKYTQRDDVYYTFAEAPRFLGEAGGENIVRVPAGEYYFRKDRSSKMEYALGIFDDRLGREFMVFEVEEIISGKTRINEPLYELRLVG